MCKPMEELYKENWIKGFKEGMEEMAIEIAVRMLQEEKMSPEETAKLTRLPLEKVQSLC